jgi:hypothetical protein
MQGLNYTRLNSISNSVSPYRGSLNRFPIGSRRHNTKYFLVRNDEGERVFDIVHGSNWKHITLTKTEYDESAKKGMPRLNSYQSQDGTWEYYRYEVYPNILGVVRPDNTFEFTANQYGQGERGILSTYGHGELSTDSRRGGMIWRGSQGGKLRNDKTRGAIPIYKGLRVDCETMQPTKPITVIGRKVDRKVGKDLLAGYKDFYAITEVMTKAMDYEVFVKTTAEVVKEHHDGDGSAWHWQAFKAKADTLVHTAPLDAAILYIMGWDIGSMRWNLRRFLDTQHSRHSAHEDTPHTMFLNLKRRLNKEIYKANDGVFKKVEYTNGEMFPPSEWGYTVMVDGVEVEQYD